LCWWGLNEHKCVRHEDDASRVSIEPAMTGRRLIWIATVFVFIGMTWGDPRLASSATRHLSLPSVGNDTDDDNDDDDMPLGGAGCINSACIPSCVNTIEHSPVACDTGVVDLSHGSRSPPPALADLIYQAVLPLRSTLFDRSEAGSASSFLGGSSLDLLCRPSLSRHRFRAHEVRFLLTVIAYPG